MKRTKLFAFYFLMVLSGISVFSCNKREVTEDAGNFRIGWAVADITPDRPVLMSGYFNARVSQGIMDPLTVTALAMESGSGPTSEKVIMISCDLSTIRDGSRDGYSDNLRDNIRKLIVGSLPELSHEQIILNASHTHVGPFYDSAYERDSKSAYGVELEVFEPWEYQEFLASRILDAAIQAWNSRKPGGVSYGLGHAVVGHNRLVVDMSGISKMYGPLDSP